ncbi:MAG: CBS domain-containing protein [Planctomycetota bacterium]|jgi:CBS domain-containing protein
MPTVQTIIDRKSSAVATVDGKGTVLDAAKIMNQKHIGALVVTSGEKAVGIFTERDVLNRVVATGRDPALTDVESVMTSPMACCRRETKIEECKSVMSSKRIRHVPVVEDGRLYGMISIGDILAGEVADQQATIEYLNEYLHGTR